MLIADPRALLEKLNSVSRRALEAAAGASVTGRHYEVTVEHLLHALLDVRESDLVVLLDRFQIDPSRTRARLHRSLTELRTGNAGRPGFSPLMLELLQDAWLYASTEHHATRLRSGAILVRLLHAPGRYVPLDVTLFEGLPIDDLRKNLLILAGESAEAIEDASASEWSGGGSARPAFSGAGGAGGAGGAAGGDTALARFTTNLTERARKGEIDPVFGREGEVRQVVDILCRRRKNNPIIVGEPGVGKTALVEGLALRIAEGDVPEFLKDTQVVALDLGSLQAGASVKGEFENRLKSVISEVKASPKPMVLFIDEAHTLIGAGGAQGAGDAANLLKPALARGELRTIAATTWAEFKRYFEKDAALERRFQPVKVDEPGIDAAVLMLRGLARKFEEAHGVVIRDEAVRAAVTLSSRYIAGRQLPDKAVDLLDTSAARVRVLRGAPPAVLEDARAELAAVEREIGAHGRDHSAGVVVDEEARKVAEARRGELRDRVATLEARLTEQRALVDRVDELRRDVAKIGTTDETSPERAEKLEQLRVALGRLRAIPREELVVYADVDENLVATIVADWTGIPAGRMVQDDVAAILSLEDRLRQRVRGQDPALAVIARELRSARSGLKAPGAPLGVFLLVGPSGVGKTETALALADLLFGGERFVVTINMSEFQEKHTVSRLIGSPPGYVGFGEGGMLTEAVRQRPYSVVLLDEVEKADREVLNLFYQVFDKGMLADGEGRVIDFANTVVIMTSNLATDLLTQAADPALDLSATHDELIALVKPTLSAHFKPALLARMTVVPYIPIRSDALLGITRMKLSAVANRTREAHGIELAIDDAVIDAVAARCREVESGARNIDHILRGTILPIISNALLEGIASGKATRRLRLATDEANGFACVAEER